MTISLVMIMRTIMTMTTITMTMMITIATVTVIIIMLIIIACFRRSSYLSCMRRCDCEKSLEKLLQLLLNSDWVVYILRKLTVLCQCVCVLQQTMWLTACACSVCQRAAGHNHTNRQVGRQTDTHTNRQEGRQTGRLAEKRVGRQVGRQADRQTDRQTDMTAGRVTDQT